jgi:hypothetical protein
LHKPKLEGLAQTKARMACSRQKPVSTRPLLSYCPRCATRSACPLSAFGLCELTAPGVPQEVHALSLPLVTED